MTVIGNRLQSLAMISTAATLLFASTCIQAADAPQKKDAAAVTTPRREPISGHMHTTATPTIRVIGKVDAAKRTTLYGHVPAPVKRATDMGRVNPATPTGHIVMVLKPSEAQKAELRHVIDEQQDKQTANYHQWATPEEFGEHFGVHDADIAKVSAWLKSEGFKVEDISKSKRVLRFSGTTGQVEKAFQTELHNYRLGNEAHVSISKDITVPTALSPVIAGVPLHNFFRKSKMTPPKKAFMPKLGTNVYGGACTNNAVPSTCNEYVGPGDFATIYNTAPLLASGINGTGSSIAIIGRSDILLSDVQSYRQIFNLVPNDPTFINAGQDGGIVPGDDGESDLDVEISGGIAPNAKVFFVVGASNFFLDGISTSVQYAVENNVADIISMSYGDCESNEGMGGNAFNAQAFEQAAAQGISVFIADGDNGPAECDDPSSTFENLGYAGSAEGSTPYSVSVGGTQFDEGTSNSTYWSVSGNAINLGNALSYIPEWPWNEAAKADFSDTPSADLEDLWSGSGGVSAYYLQPSWQRGPGVPASDPSSLSGGNWVSSINITNGGSGYTTAPKITIGTGCTTTAAATASLTGGVVTAINFTLLTAQGTQAAGHGITCTSVPTVTLAAAPTGGTTATATAVIGPMLNIQPLVTGVPHRYTPDLSLNAASDHDGSIFCSEGVCENTPAGLGFGVVGGTSVAAPSMAGIQALINQANGGRQGLPGYIYYALAAAQSQTGCNSSTPPASGSNCAFQDITQGDNLICGGTSSCPAKIGFSATPGYDLATGLGSVNAANMAALWKTVTFNSSSTTLGLSQTTGVAQGTSINFSGSVASGSGGSTPTGDVVFILSQGEFGTAIPVGSSTFGGPGPYTTLDSSGNYTVSLSNLPGGSYTVTARYGGDSTYASSLSAAVPVTVNAGNASIALTPYALNNTACTLSTAASFSYDQLTWLQAYVTATNGSGVPTGTVTINVDGKAYATETLDPNGSGYLLSGALTTSSCLYDYLYSEAQALPVGSHTITAIYSGDATFAGLTSAPTTITVTPLTITPTLAAAGTVITSGFADQLTATFSLSSIGSTATSTNGQTGVAGPTGTVTFTDTTTGAVLGSATVVNGFTFNGVSYAYSATAVLSTTGITTTGVNAITATYSGDQNYTSTTSTAVTVTVSSTGAATTTAVTSTANPTTLGGRPTFTATIANAAGGTAPTAGTATFYDGTTVLGTGTVGTAHTATLKLGSTTAFYGGTHNITAAYGGTSTTFSASTSPVFVETVTQGTNTISLTAKTLGQVGQNYTFAAVLTPSSTSTSFAPNQALVQFFDGSTNIGSAMALYVPGSLEGYGLWTATLTDPSLTVGTHTITATYSDVNYSAATSNAQTVKVYGSPIGADDQAVDSATSSSTIPTSDTLFVSGWAADATDGSPLATVVIYIDGKSVGSPTLGVSRPDVAAAFGNPAYAKSGYNFTYPASSLSVGTHTLYALATNGDNITTKLNTLTFTVSTVAKNPVGNLDQAIDATTGGSSVASADSLFVSGWAADYQDNGPASVQVLIDGAVSGTATMGLSRPDVASFYGMPTWSTSGYSEYIPVSGLTPGAHTVTVLATDSLNLTTSFGPLTFTVTP